MARQSHSTSAASSLATGGCLFDDDASALGGICFDLDDAHMHHASSWCKSSSASCCSLCRPPAVSEGEDDSFPGSFDLDEMRPQFKNSCGGPCECLLQAPLKSISIPQICFDPSASVKSDPRAPNDGRDLLSMGYLPDDALCHIVKFLGVPTLVRLRECNVKLRDVASKNSAGWKDHCVRLWSRKAHVCARAHALLAKSNKADNDNDDEGPSNSSCAAMEAYKLSVADAATRNEISFEELCFDASPDKAGLVWSFRFKESAGRDWTSWDPWWNRQDARKLVFLRDGTVKQVYPQGLEDSAEEIDGVLLYDVFSERTIHRDGADIPAPRIEMRWRFVDRPLDLARRPPGAYVRISVGDRDVPTYVVRRSANGNWGFVLESCWGVYASFDLAPRAPTLSATWRARRHLRRTRNHQDDVEGGGDGDDGEFSERMRNVRRRIDLFLEESSMTQNGNAQWKEALLYNIGATTLPDGDAAVGDFNQAWQNAVMRR